LEQAQLQENKNKNKQTKCQNKGFECPSHPFPA